VPYVNVVWHVKVHARDHYEYDPETGDIYMLLQIFFGVTKTHEGTGEVSHHTEVKEYPGYLSSQLSLSRLAVSYSADAFAKSWHISLPDYEETFTLSVPPFNGNVPLEPNVDEQVHTVQVWMPEPSPPPTPPVQPPPIVIPPPEGPPIERPLEPKPEEPPFQPPDRPPPIFGPPDRQPPPRLTNDYLTWNAFVAKYGDRIKRWALEVPLDYGDLPPDPNAPPQYKAMWQRLTGHKADAFIDFGHVIYVAEIKPRLTLAALGQAYFGYQLAVKRYRFDKPVKPCVICSTAPHSLLPIASQNGITVFVLEGITGGQTEE
jgi:hypothetical protein